LVKYKKSSTAYEQYGPYALADLATNRVVHVNLHPIDVERALFRDTDETSPASRAG
jgi:hypothetical protein